MALEARRLHVRFDAVEALDGVDLCLAPGRATALVGPNGAGKTTLARCLAGILRPAAGDVTLDGRSLGDLSRRDAARQISVVPQSAPPAFAFSVLEFVVMGFHARSARFSLDGEQQRSAAIEALGRLGVAELAGRSMTALSGGERQRVVMARTLVTQAKYWLLDEPTSNLDLAHRVALLEVVREHVEDGGAALAIVHDINLVQPWFDEVVVLDHGRVVASGDAADTLQPELLEDVFSIRMRWIDDARGGAWIPDRADNLDPRSQLPVEAGGPGGE